MEPLTLTDRTFVERLAVRILICDVSDFDKERVDEEVQLECLSDTFVLARELCSGTNDPRRKNVVLNLATVVPPVKCERAFGYVVMV